jgi:nitrogen fixation-related uncharacterized protein
VSIAIGVFFWAVKSNQFEDLERHGSSILFDDDLPKKVTKKKFEETPKEIPKEVSEKDPSVNPTKNKNKNKSNE